MNETNQTTAKIKWKIEDLVRALIPTDVGRSEDGKDSEDEDLDDEGDSGDPLTTKELTTLATKEIAKEPPITSLRKGS